MNEFARHLIQRLFEDHHADLHAMLSRRLGCTHIAADVAQDSYMRLMEVQEPEEIRHPRAFLFRIARNLAANARRVRAPTRAMAHAHEHELNAIPATYAIPEQTYAEAELDRLLKEVIKNLPPRQREVFLLHRYRDMTQTQIAAMLGISVHTVEKHIGAALEACRMTLREAGIDCP